jgi:hypothetical protein
MAKHAENNRTAKSGPAWNTSVELQFQRGSPMTCRSKSIRVMVAVALACGQLGAQVLSVDDLKKIVPSSFFFAGQSAPVQLRNSVGLKNTAGKVILAGLVDTSGYSTAIQEKYQGFLITEAKLSFDATTLDPGAYGFGFKEGKFIVMNLASTDLLSVASKSDEQLKRPVPLKLEKEGEAYRLYAGRKYVLLKAD